MGKFQDRGGKLIGSYCFSLYWCLSCNSAEFNRIIKQPPNTEYGAEQVLGMLLTGYIRGFNSRLLHSVWRLFLMCSEVEDEHTHILYHNLNKRVKFIFLF